VLATLFAFLIIGGITYPWAVDDAKNTRTKA
jgi:hypothetical protein